MCVLLACSLFTTCTTGAWEAIISLITGITRLLWAHMQWGWNSNLKYRAIFQPSYFYFLHLRFICLFTSIYFGRVFFLSDLYFLFSFSKVGWLIGGLGCLFFETGSLYVLHTILEQCRDKAGLKLPDICLTPTPRYWDWRCAPGKFKVVCSSHFQIFCPPFTLFVDCSYV